MNSRWLFLIVSGFGCGSRSVPPGQAADGDIDTESDFADGGDTDVDTDSETDTGSDTASDTDSTSDTASDGGDAPLRVETWCKSLAAALCGGEEACCDGGWPEGEMDSCIDLILLLCEDPVDDAVTDGLAEFDADRGATCLDGIETTLSECAVPIDLSATVPDCESVFVGSLVDGEECRATLECAPGLRCMFEDFAGERATCRTPVALGEACDGNECATGLYCEPYSATCEPLPVEGEACGDAFAGLPFLVSFCGEGLWCDADDVCRAQGDDGASCVDDGECLSDACEGGRCAPPADRYCRD